MCLGGRASCTHRIGAVCGVSFYAQMILDTFIWQTQTHLLIVDGVVAFGQAVRDGDDIGGLILAARAKLGRVAILLGIITSLAIGGIIAKCSVNSVEEGVEQVILVHLDLKVHNFLRVDNGIGHVVVEHGFASSFVLGSRSANVSNRVADWVSPLGNSKCREIVKGVEVLLRVRLVISLVDAHLVVCVGSGGLGDAVKCLDALWRHDGVADVQCIFNSGLADNLRAMHDGWVCLTSVGFVFLQNGGIKSLELAGSGPGHGSLFRHLDVVGAHGSHTRTHEINEL